MKMHRLRRFLRLAPADRRLLIESALSLAAMRLALSLLSFQLLLNLLARVSRKHLDGRGAHRPPSDRIAWAVNLASDHVPATANCLVRALAVQLLLALWCQPAQLRFGVAKGTSGELRAHAWVESYGTIVIGGSELDAFAPLG